jgi:hypothetical protein
MPVILLSNYFFPFIGLNLFDSIGIIAFTFFLVSYSVGKFVTAFTFGTSLWTLRKIINDTSKRDLVVMGGIGLFFYILSINESIYLPLEDLLPPTSIPYGIVTLSLAGLFAYMMSRIRIDELFLNRQIR